MAKNKDEAKFTTYFKNRMKAHYGPKLHWFKIPDSGSGRFLIPKPYDAYALIPKKGFVAFEFKYKKELGAIGMYDLRPSQVDGLQSVVDSGHLALVIFEIKVGRANYRMLTFEFSQFKTLGSIHRRELVDMIHRGYCYEIGGDIGFKIPPSTKAREHQLSGFFVDLEYAIAVR